MTCERGEEHARAVNEMLYRGQTMQRIAEFAGVSQSSIHRHRHGACPHGYSRWLVSRRTNHAKTIGRTIVRWEDESLSYFDTPIEEKDLRPDDILFVVVRPPIPIDALYADACKEDAARSAALAEETADAETANVSAATDPLQVPPN
jgi:hypothetical protein